MLRRSFVLLGILSSIFLAVAGWLTSREVDATYPAGTHYSIGVSTQSSNVGKADIVAMFDAFADDHSVALIKVHPSWVGDQSVEELVVFGGGDSVSEPPVNVGERILVESSSLGTRGLSGHYALGDCLDCAHEFFEVAERLGLDIVWFETRSVLALVEELASSGTGFSLFALLLLTTSVSVLWSSGMAYSRHIRVVAGLSTLRILADDLLWLCRWFGIPVLGTGLVLTIAVAAVWDRELVTVFSMVLWPGAGVVMIFAFVINTLMVYSTIDPENLVRRENGVGRRLAVVGLSLRVTALVLVFIAAPYSVLLGGRAQSAQEDAERWSVAQAYVKLTNNTLVLEDEEAYADRFTDFVFSEGGAEHFAMSFTVGQMIDLSDSDLSPYDQWIIVDEGFINALEIERSYLVEVRWDSLPSHVQEVMTENLDFWTDANGLEFVLYEWEGTDSFPSLGSVAGDGNSVSATHPIILVPTNPYRDFNALYLLSPLAANGQIVFTDGEWLEGQMLDYGLSPFVASIDNVVDEMSASARAYGQQALLAALSFLLSLLALIVIIVESARTWAGMNRRLVFAQVSSGYSTRYVARSPLRLEVLVLGAAMIVAIFMSLLFLRIDGFTVVVTLAVLVAIYLPVSVMSFDQSVTSSFFHSIQRRS